MTDHDYSNERIVGHGVDASLKDPLLDDEIYDAYGIAPMYERIKITEGDVDWDDTRSVTITKEELAGMAEVFLDD